MNISASTLSCVMVSVQSVVCELVAKLRGAFLNSHRTKETGILFKGAAMLVFVV